MSAIKREVSYVLISLFLSCSVGFCSPKEPGRPFGKNKKFNVVLIMLHAFPRNHLGCYGYPENTSPFIDALSRDGITFNNAFCPFPFTWASLPSIYTSLYPSSHGVIYIYKDRMPDKVYTLAQILRIHGYFTAWFGEKDNPSMGADVGALKGFGVLKGFDEVNQLKLLQFQTRRPLVFKGGFDEWRQLRESSEGIPQWIKKHDKEQFFLTIHSGWPHPMVIPWLRGFDNRFSRRIPREFLEGIDQSYKDGLRDVQEEVKTNPEFLYRIFGKDWVVRNQEFLLQPYSRFNVLHFSRGDKYKWHYLCTLLARPVFKFMDRLEGQRLQYYKWLLDSALLEVDKDFVGQVVNTLKKEGVYDKTMIIVMADHGNEYKEHGHMGHGGFLYDEDLRIPMIFHIPGLSPGIKIDSIVESVDILPTICDLLGIPIPSQAQGVSLRRLWEHPGLEGEERYAISQCLRDLGAIRTSQWKLIMDKKGLELKELYDLKKDPGELHNVISSNPEVAQKLSKEYISKIESLPSYQNNKSEFLPEIDDQTRKKILQTGYW